MKLTKSELKQIIKEELENILLERDWSEVPGVVGRGLGAMYKKWRHPEEHEAEMQQRQQKVEQEKFFTRLFEFMGFKEAAERVVNLPPEEELKDLQRALSTARQTPGKPGAKEARAAIKTAHLERRQADKGLKDVIGAFVAKNPDATTHQSAWGPPEEWELRLSGEAFTSRKHVPFYLSDILSRWEKTHRDVGGEAAEDDGDPEISAMGGSAHYENKNMKLTKSQLRQIIKEKLSDDSGTELVSVLQKLSDKLDNLDVSIDYLAASVTGDSPMNVGVTQQMYGRAATPHRRERTASLDEIVEEEIEKALSERGFGEGEPAKDELSKKRGVYLEGEEGDHPGQSCKKAHSKQSHKKWKKEKDLEEKKLTKPEKKEKKRLVKGMKKNKSDFEKRYPGRGKSVMYATATKRAKERK